MSQSINNPAAALAQQTQNEIYALTHQQPPQAPQPQAPDPQVPQTQAPQTQAPQAQPPRSVPPLNNNVPQTDPNASHNCVSGQIDPILEHEEGQQIRMNNGLENIAFTLADTQNALGDILQHLGDISTILTSSQNSVSSDISRQINKHLKIINQLAGQYLPSGNKSLASLSFANNNGIDGHLSNNLLEISDFQTLIKQTNAPPLTIINQSLLSVIESNFSIINGNTVQASETTLPLMLGLTESSFDSNTMAKNAGRMSGYFSSKAQKTIETATTIFEFIRSKIALDAKTIEILLRYGNLKKEGTRKNENSFEIFQFTQKLKYYFSSQRNQTRFTLSNGYATQLLMTLRGN